MFKNISSKLSGGSSQPEQKHDGMSLTTILQTDEERAELTLLIANATESMRNTIVDAFDPHMTGKVTDVNPPSTEPKTEDEKITNPNVDTANADVEATDQERKEREKKEEQEKKLLEKRIKETEDPAAQALKKDALTQFDNWRDSVLLRIGEVVNSREEAEIRENNKDEPPPKADQEGTGIAPMQHDDSIAHALHELYPPADTPLRNLPEPQRALILHSLLLLLLSLEHYSSHSRILLLFMTSSLGLSVELLTEDEAKVAKGLLEAAESGGMSADEETKKKAEANSTARKWKVGLASVGGAVLIGVTGGLAAPLLAAGIGTVMGGLGLGATAAAGYLGTLAGSSVLVGGLFGAYGGRMTGKVMDQYAKEVSDFRFIPVRDFHRPRKIDKEFRRLRVGIGISGWLTEEGDITTPWRVVAPSIEGFALRWEVEALLRLGNAISTMLTSAAWSVAKSEIIKHTVFAALTAGLWPLAIVKASRVIDNPFSVAKSRSEKAGEVLADALINRCQGERPVTLIGYSLGARVIYSCLNTLADRRAFGFVESVVLLGAPTPSDSAEWRKIRSVVSGRVVNVYSTNDYVLAFLYRTSSVQYGIAGLQKVEGVKGVENVDVTELVSGHIQYRHLTGSILKKIGFEDIDTEAVAKEEEELRKEEEERQRQQEEKKDGEEEDVETMEKEVEKKNERGMMAWATNKLSIGRKSVGSRSPSKSPTPAQSPKFQS